MAKRTLCDASSAGPALIDVAQPATVRAPALAETCWSAPRENEGAPCTAVTVSTKELDAVRPAPAATVRVTVAVPLRLLAGVAVTVRLAPDPVTTMPASGS